MDYYDTLLKLRNVKLVSQTFSGDFLKKKSIAVATLTGTVIYESQMIGKPCICMGNTVRNVLNGGIYSVKTQKQCMNLIELIESGDYEILSREKLFEFWHMTYNICFNQNEMDEVLTNYCDVIQNNI